ncbi:SDR family NAD(P)-dependent oxidoreductase [Mycobacterium arosiense]|uniref:Ketoreductase domain-containing protein n=1 Tax=Mycobacterium arosiense ATCC BAA-1401 = DSM 45069 TaxID=1265311 RepID=A0A1W9Z6B8_MYCAI|nr:SDR family oxidoreductase [Mycobacterium arosiense]ORA07620.1 hypothetical protein BST14_27045 [Mycobacterium arosiense ATCC BAA-1401 = DSM 45069]
MAIPAPSQNTVAIVTGASSGIGAECARRLAHAGHRVVLVARSLGKLEKLAAELESRGSAPIVKRCDVSSAQDRGHLVRELDESGMVVETAVLNAGFGMGGPFIEHDPDRLQTMLRTNIEGVVMLASAWAPLMAARQRGAILIVSSSAGNQPTPNLGAYCATKAAVTSFAEMLHEELRHCGVTVTVLCPGKVETEFTEVAQVHKMSDRVPSALTISAPRCAQAGLDALAVGRRKVVPNLGPRALYYLGGALPTGIWLRGSRRLLSNG